MDESKSELPRTPQISSISLYLPPSSVPELPRAYHSPSNVLSSSPDPKSETDIDNESPGKSLTAIHQSLYGNMSWRPVSQAERLEVERNRLWPLTDPVIRQQISCKRTELYDYLATYGIREYQTFLAMIGTNTATAVPCLVLLTREFVKSQLEAFTSEFKVVNLRYYSHRQSQDTLLKEYIQSPIPGTIVGANDRPTTSFSTGWWVRDCESGSVFNLSAAHPLRTAVKKPPHGWSITSESLHSQTIDSPPVCLVNSTSLALRREINHLQTHRGRPDELESKLNELRSLRQYLERRDFATVVAAGYGEYKMENEDDNINQIEDWSLLRARSDRIGRNEFPLMTNFDRTFTSVGRMQVGMRCVLNGAISGVREGIIMDEIVLHIEGHDTPTKSWVVREVGWGTFGTDGDSGAPIGLEGGRAAGIYISGGIGSFEDGTLFPFSTVTDLRTTFERIKTVTGRTLEIPSQYDLSRKLDRDLYHLQKTGRRRERH